MEPAPAPGGTALLVMAVAGLVGAALWLVIHPERPLIPSLSASDVLPTAPADVAPPAP